MHPVECDSRQIALSFSGRQLGALLSRVELDEDVSLPYRSARIEGDSIDRAGEIGADRYSLNGGHRSDDAQRVGPLLLLGDQRRDGFGRWLESCGLADGGLDLLEFHESESRKKDRCHGQHQNHPFCHELLSSGWVMRIGRARPAPGIEGPATYLSPGVFRRLTCRFARRAPQRAGLPLRTDTQSAHKRAAECRRRAAPPF